MLPPSFRRPATYVGMALVAALLPTPFAYGAPQTGAASPVAGSGPVQPPATVTLITGDKVTVTPGPPGTAPEVSVERAPGATGSVRISVTNGHTFVYPDEAAPFVAAGRLDTALFDVTELVAQGYDDKNAAELPLILTHTAGSATLASDGAKDAAGAQTALPGTETTLSLPAVHGEAVRTHRSKAAAFWSTLTGPARKGHGKDKADSAADAPRTAPFAAGIDKVWLDGKVKPTLADSTAQIGAPAAWASGGTGAGVRVAVLDTGVDAAHPDLAPRIVDSKSFVPGETVTDRAGHGTHTASTIAGTGAASGGQERGVAPDADLVVGKVLSDKGPGLDSWIIAGMEWAARTEHAKVISMSLGDATRHAQNDPLSIAVNQLSAETGALFVVAAGNEGPNPYTVTSPGTADAALTVGAVDSSNALAGFSGAGPRQLDDGLKPDITAPGVAVWAARSQYSQDGGEGYYVGMDGTSMATPHVAGSAVLLAQKHPDWTAQDLKNALMSTSMRTPDYSPYQAGTGRVMIPAAYYAEVFASGSVDAGIVPWAPGSTPQPIRRQVTYTNTTDSPVTLDLSVDADGASSGAFSLGAGQVTVPAHGTAQTDVVVDPQGLAPGTHSAQIVATGATPGGSATLHTAVGVSVESEKHNLTIQLKDRSGRPISGSVSITGDNGVDTSLWVPESGTLTSRWAPGTYALRAYVDVEGTHGPSSVAGAVLVAPEVKLSADRSVVLDASQARQVKVDTPKPTAVTDSRLDVWRSFTSSKPEPGVGVLDVLFPSPAYDSLWALPTGDNVTEGSFAFGTRFRAPQTPLAITAGGHDLKDLLPQPGSPSLPEGTSRLDAVFAGNGASADYAALSARGKAVVVRGGTVAATDQAAAAASAGAALLLVVGQGPGQTYDWYGKPDLATTGTVPVASIPPDEGEQLIADTTAAGKGGAHLSTESNPTPDYLYDLADYHVGAVPADPSADTDPRHLARIDENFAVPAGKSATEMRDDYPPYFWEGQSAFIPGKSLHLPFERKAITAGTRTDWVSTKGVRWQEFTVLDHVAQRTETESFEAASTQPGHWFSPIVRPRMLNALVRYPYDVFSGDVEGYSDSGSAHAGSSGTQSTALYQGDNELLSGFPFTWVGAGNLAPEKLPYRLVVDTSDTNPVGPYSTATHTEWRFTSGAVTTEQQIPLVQLDYDVDVDSEGRAGRKTDLVIKPSVLGGSSSADDVSAVTLEVSYDDGATWQKQEVKEKKGAWRATLTAPSGAQNVSLRVNTEQHDGNGVTQTIVRAFGLTP
ncbi:S8 family peptidase [Streptacidiphilus griseoplanus]|uniref:S8 family peptidase n=1 Tax=Peterkaempfera griseoplana TaxID=66896 RepID=UPI000AF3C99C|nr:S8 family serine peptidase [Peterkaempfera griseoplana]